MSRVSIASLQASFAQTGKRTTVGAQGLDKHLSMSSAKKAKTTASGTHKGVDVKGVVMQVNCFPGQKPRLLCLLHDTGSARLGANSIVTNETLKLTPKPKSSDTTAIELANFATIEVSNNTKNPDELPRIGDAIWLCNLTVFRGTSRTFFDVSFTKMDTDVSGMDVLERAPRSVFYVQPYKTDAYNPDVFLPVGPLPKEESLIQTPGVYAQVTKVEEDFVNDEGKLFANMDVSTMQWMTEEKVDHLAMPAMRCWHDKLVEFGITNPDVWAALAPTVLTRCHFFLHGYYHKETTLAMRDNNPGSEKNPGESGPRNPTYLGVRVKGFGVNPLTLVRDCGVPITKDCARQLCAKTGEQRDNPWNTVNPIVLNLTEHKDAAVLFESEPETTLYYACANTPGFEEALDKNHTPESGAEEMSQFDPLSDDRLKCCVWAVRQSQ